MNTKFTEEKLIIKGINFSSELSRGNSFLCNQNTTIFNSSILKLKNSTNLLVASRGWYGNIRSWSGVNFVILSLFNKDYKKLKQNILEFNPNLVRDDIILNFKNDKIITHEETILKGPEDSRLFYHNGDIYIMFNELTDSKKRHMFVSKVDLKTLTYGSKIEICKSLSSSFEKNWGTFIYKSKLHMIYDINPLKIFEVDNQFNCKMICNKRDSLFTKFSESFPDLKFHLRNSTNLIDLGKNIFLGMGHSVLDYKNNTDINKFLIPAFDKSKYSKSDKDYFKKYFKLYTGFFYKVDMNLKEVTEISPFFQLPNFESKQELIFFPMSIYKDEKDFINISYNVGDNRSYYLKLHLDIINLSLYKKENIDFQVNHNINLNYYQELIRNIRKIIGLSVKKGDYYKFKISSKAASKKRKSKRKTRRKKR